MTTPTRLASPLTAAVSPTADGLARALALVDASAIPGAAWCDEATFSAVFAVARAALALEAEPSPKRGDRQAYRRLDKLTDELAAAIADLCDLAAPGGAS